MYLDILGTSHECCSGFLYAPIMHLAYTTFYDVEWFWNCQYRSPLSIMYCHVIYLITHAKCIVLEETLNPSSPLLVIKSVTTFYKSVITTYHTADHILMSE